MSDIAIRVENLSKQYRIGAKRERYQRFTEAERDPLTTLHCRLSTACCPSSDGDEGQQHDARLKASGYGVLLGMRKAEMSGVFADCRPGGR